MHFVMHLFNTERVHMGTFHLGVKYSKYERSYIFAFYSEEPASADKTKLHWRRRSADKSNKSIKKRKL